MQEKLGATGSQRVTAIRGDAIHSAVMNADWLPDEMAVRSLCRRMVCTRCGMIGADVRLDWSPHVNKRAR